MARADRNYPDIYFGRPGSLIKMPWPRNGMGRSFARRVSEFQTAAGQSIVSSIIGGSRIYSLSWRALHMDTYEQIEQYWVGAMGAGPWVLIDPSMANLLLPNQAATGAVYNDTRHMAVTNGTLLANSNATHFHRPGVIRNLRWVWQDPPSATPTLTFTYPYRSWYGFPVVPGLPYVFSGWMKPDGTVDSNITMSLRMDWLNATGGVVSQITSGDIPTTGWTRHSVSGTAPAGTAYVKPSIVLTGATITNLASVYLDELQLEQDSVLNPWTPSTGLRPVEIVDLPENAPFNGRFRTDVVMGLRELTP